MGYGDGVKALTRIKPPLQLYDSPCKTEKKKSCPFFRPFSWFLRQETAVFAYQEGYERERDDDDE